LAKKGKKREKKDKSSQAKVFNPKNLVLKLDGEIKSFSSKELSACLKEREHKFHLDEILAYRSIAQHCISPKDIFLMQDQVLLFNLRKASNRKISRK